MIGRNNVDNTPKYQLILFGIYQLVFNNNYFSVDNRSLNFKFRKVGVKKKLFRLCPVLFFFFKKKKTINMKLEPLKI